MLASQGRAEECCLGNSEHYWRLLRPARRLHKRHQQQMICGFPQIDLVDFSS